MINAVLWKGQHYNKTNRTAALSNCMPCNVIHNNIQFNAHLVEH